VNVIVFGRQSWPHFNESQDRWIGQPDLPGVWGVVHQMAFRSWFLFGEQIACPPVQPASAINIL
jgi:hypothetical protein